MNYVACALIAFAGLGAMVGFDRYLRRRHPAFPSSLWYQNLGYFRVVFVVAEGFFAMVLLFGRRSR